MCHCIITTIRKYQNMKITQSSLIWLIFRIWSCSCLAADVILSRWKTEHLWAWIFSEITSWKCLRHSKKVRSHSQLNRLTISQNLIKTKSQTNLWDSVCLQWILDFVKIQSWTIYKYYYKWETQAWLMKNAAWLHCWHECMKASLQDMINLCWRNLHR